jgi:hypothetical protein
MSKKFDIFFYSSNNHHLHAQKKDDFSVVLDYPTTLLFLHNRFERSQQLRGYQRMAIAIEDCWLWLMPAESSLSKIGIGQGQRFATANNSPPADK